MKIIVTTYTKNEYLIENFSYLANKFLGLPFVVDVASEEEKLSTQLKRIVDSISDEYFILLKEDFYILEKVDVEYLKKCWEYAIKHKVDRFSLQSVGDGYERTTEPYGQIDDILVSKLMPNESYLCSLEASIWRREFLKDNIFEGGSDRDVELLMSRKVKGNTKILVPHKKVLIYSDALRGGSERIKIIDGWFYVMVQGPSGEDLWKNTQIKKE